MAYFDNHETLRQCTVPYVFDVTQNILLFFCFSSFTVIIGFVTSKCLNMITSKTYVVPSPNEIACLMREQQIKRRKLRLCQVRLQGQSIAKDIRTSVEQKKRLVLQDIASEINKQQTKNQNKQLTYVEDTYSKGLKNVGKAHNCASQEEPDQALCEAIFEEKKKIAKRRYHNAINQLHEVKYLEEKESLAKSNLRKLVSQKENLRAKRIALLPKPDNRSNEGTLSTEPSGSTFSTHTSNQSSVVIVERATKAEHDAFEDAKSAALIEEEKYNDKNHQQMMTELARQEKAKFRHLAALRQTRMENEYANLENQLKVLQKKDALKRRENLSCIPNEPSLDVSLQDLMI